MEYGVDIAGQKANDSSTDKRYYTSPRDKQSQTKPANNEKKTTDVLLNCFLFFRSYRPVKQETEQN